MKTTSLPTSHHSVTLAAVAGAVLLALFAQSAHAGRDHFVIKNPKYQQECGSCHTAMPPQLLSPASWQSVMDHLATHFGTDASLDQKDHDELLKYLKANAGKYTNSLQGKPLQRISETRWFVREHSEEMPRDVFKHPAVKSVANCSACHVGADKGDYSEETLRLPKGIGK